MRILHVSESIDPATGGPANSVTSLASAQAALGHCVSLVCYAEHHFERHLKLLSERLPEFVRIRVVGIPYAGCGERLLARAAGARIKSLIAETDVTHVHGVWKPFNFVAARAALSQHRPLVIAPRGMLDPWSLGQSYWKKKLALKLLWRELLDATHFVHALNSSEASGIASLALRATIKVFGNGVFPELFRDMPDDSIFRAAHPQVRDRPYILFLSRLHYKKGLDYLIDAFEEFCRYEQHTDLVIAGPDGGMQSQVMRWMHEKQLQSRVHLVGALHGQAKWSALSGAVCFCLPSRQEGFSMAIAEALASRIPVLISENCHFPEVGEAGAGFVVPLATDRIAAALLRCANDRTWRARASQAGSNLIMNRYNWRVIAADLVQAYSEAQ